MPGSVYLKCFTMVFMDFFTLCVVDLLHRLIVWGGAYENILQYSLTNSQEQ